MPGDGAARPRGGHAPRRRHRRRAARRAGRRRARRPAGAPRQQQVARGAARGARGGRRPHRRRQLRRARPARRAPRRGRPPPQGAACAPRPASRRTPTTSSAPARSTRSSASAWPPATPREPSPARRTRRRSSWSASHMHIGSQVFVADFFHQAVEVVAPWVREVGLPELSIGGGLGVAYVEGEEAPTITEWGTAIVLGLPRRRDHRAGRRRAGPVDRRPGRRDPLHRRHDQGGARTCAPTCPSTAACPTTRVRCSTARATRRSCRGPPTPPGRSG